MDLDQIRHWVYVGCRRSRFFWGTLFGRAQCAWWGVRLGPNVRFHGRTRFRRFPGSRISIDRDCYLLSSPSANLIGINRPCIIATMTRQAEVRVGYDSGLSGTVLAAFESIILGDHVICGANTLVTDSNWHPDDARSGSPAPVRIGNKVWLGVGTIVLKSVSIGDNSIIGAGSVVTGDIPPNVIAAGNPCRVIKPL